MMHTYEELYKIDGQKFYTRAYIEVNNIPKAKRYDREGWSKCYSLGSNKDTINIYTALGVIKGDTYRAERNAERAEETKRNKMLKVIMEHYKTLSTEELEKMVATL